MKKKKFTKIRENITEVEYQKLLTYLNGKEDLTTNTKNNLRRTFILLYFTGMRVNEVKQLKVKDINSIYEKEVHISEYSDSNVGVQPDTFAMRFSSL